MSGDGPFARRCEAQLGQALGVVRAMLTPSCTQALELAALLLDVGPGDEIIVPSYTFVSTINAFVLRGAKPIFADIRGDTMNLDESLLADLITPHTKAIVPVHYAGVSCEMDRICEIAAQHGLAVIEDNAHGLFGRYRGRYLGTLGDLAAQSFHETKNFTCGEGGALLINDERYVERAEILREKGTNRSRFFRGEVDKYTWVDLGSSYLPSEFQAAILLGQLEARDAIQSRRREIWEYYNANLAAWADEHGACLPHVPSYCDQTYHMFYVVLQSLEQRRQLAERLRERSIAATFHYVPLHTSPMGRRFGGSQGDCPVTEAVSDCLLRLPFFVSLTDEEQDRVVSAIIDAEID